MRSPRLAFAVGILAALAGCATPAPAPAERDETPQPGVQRVVLVTIDTLRADSIGAYGGTLAETPHLDALAEQGVRFATVVAPTPLTLPSHATLLTGLDPPLHGVHHDGVYRLDAGIPTLATRFQEGGVATAAFVGASVLDRRYGLARGFDVYGDEMDYRRTPPAAGGHAERTADRVVDAALAWLEDAPDRFFLWVHLYDPHASYDPPPGYRPSRRGAGPSAEQVGFLESAAANLPPYYAGEVRFSDAQLGRLIEAVTRRHPPSGTLLAVTSDHGESLGRHGELTHGLGVYDVTQKVPLLMAGPGIPAGTVVEAPVRLADVAPTLAGYAGLPPLKQQSGSDLRPWIDGQRSDPLDAYVETLAPWLDYGWSPVLGVRTEDWKYLRSPRPELYAVATDPDETRNLVDERPEVVTILEAWLEQRLRGARPVTTAEEQPLGWVGGPDPKDERGSVVAILESRSYLQSGRLDEAERSLAGVSEAGGHIAEIRSEIARARGDSDAAVREARRSVDAAPDRAAAWVALGNALGQAGRSDEARRAFQKAAELDPGDASATRGMGRLAEADGDVDGAVSWYQKATGGRAPDVEAALRLAAIHFERGQPGRARRLLADAWDAPGGSPESRIRVARAEAEAGYPALAIGRLQDAASGTADAARYVRAAEAIYAEYGALHFPRPEKLAPAS